MIPEQLLPRACTHECTADHVHEAHLQLPPSMGDPLVTMQDDMAPEMSKIQYAVRVKVTRTRERDNKDVVLVEGLKKLRVVPAVAEAPPLSLGGSHDNYYVLSKTKSLKKGMFSGKLGRITVSAAQTGALILPAPSQGRAPATTMATVTLRFDPQGESSEPPRLGGLTTKIKATTFYAAKPTDQLASRSSQFYDPCRGTYSITTPLSSRCVESVTWTKHVAPHRRDSDSSTSSSDYSDAPPSYTHSSTYIYAATILVPISLSSTKAWVPTFHSCVVSRIYAIDLSLTIHTPGTAVPASTVNLHLPVQIAATANQTERALLTPAEAAAELADANDFFRPRVVEALREDLVGNSMLGSDLGLPPSYEDFFGGSMVTVEPGRS